MPSSVLLTTLCPQFTTLMQTMPSHQPAAYFAVDFIRHASCNSYQDCFLATFEVSQHPDQPFLLLIRLFLRFREPYVRTGNRRWYLGGIWGVEHVATQSYLTQNFMKITVKIFKKRVQWKQSNLQKMTGRGYCALTGTREYKEVTYPYIF